MSLNVCIVFGQVIMWLNEELPLSAVVKIRLKPDGTSAALVSAENRLKISELWAYMSYCSHFYTFH